jgi:hypothetical protein
MDAGIEQSKSLKADLVKALAESFVYCDDQYAAMTDAAGLPEVAFDVTYMRLKGIVPPSSEPRAAR